MKRDSKLSDVLHVLLHLADYAAPVKSETMAKMLNTNPVVVRRILAGLRKHGFVSSEKGHGGGWQLSCDFYEVTLQDIYKALESPPIFAIGVRSKSPHCLVEKAVNTAMNEAFQEAEALLLERFGQVTLAQLVHLIHQDPRMGINAGNEQKEFENSTENENQIAECQNQERRHPVEDSKR